MAISSLKSPIIAEINWIYSLIVNAIKPSEEGALSEPPALSEELAYAKYLLNTNPSLYERIVLSLAHCFQFAPNFFKSLFHQEQQSDIGIDSFGLIPHNGTGLAQPTLHTANWICDVYNIETQFLDEDHFLFADDILESLSYHPSIFNTPLIFSKKAQHLFFGEVEYLPEFSKDFPAELLKTQLTKDDLILHFRRLLKPYSLSLEIV